MIAYEYFRTGGQESSINQKEAEEAKSYQYDRDLAFFVVNFHYTPAEYDALTPRQRAFIMKAYENKVVTDTTWIRDAVLNAEYNVKRKKHKPFRKLWNRILQVKKEDAKAEIDIIKKIDAKEKSWVQLVYKNSGIRSRNG